MEPVWFRRLPYAFMAKTGNSPSLFHKFRKQGRAVSTVTWVQAGSSVDGWLSGARYYLSLHYVQTSSEAHPVTYSMGCIHSFPRGKADGPLPPCGTELKNKWSYTCVSPLRLHTVHRKNNSLHFTKLCRITIFIKRCCFIRRRFWNCGMPTTASTPTIIYWYAALIKKLQYKGEKTF